MLKNIISLSVKVTCLNWSVEIAIHFLEPALIDSLLMIMFPIAASELPVSVINSLRFENTCAGYFVIVTASLGPNA